MDAWMDGWVDRTSPDNDEEVRSGPAEKRRGEEL